MGIVTSPPSTPDVPAEGWRQRLAEFLRRRERVARTREQMQAARRAGLARRHETRLRAARSGEPTNREESSS